MREDGEYKAPPFIITRYIKKSEIDYLVDLKEAWRLVLLILRLLLHTEIGIK